MAKSKEKVSKPSVEAKSKPSVDKKPSGSEKPSKTSANPKSSTSATKSAKSSTKPSGSESKSAKSAGSDKSEAKSASKTETPESESKDRTPASRSSSKRSKSKERAAKDDTSKAEDHDEPNPFEDKKEGFSKLEDEEDDDGMNDEDLDSILARRAKKKATAPPSETNTGLINALRDITATKAQEQSKKCRQHFTFIFILAALGAGGVLGTFSAYNLYQNPMNKYLWPPTEQAVYSTWKIYLVCALLFVLGILGFVLLHKEITSLPVGLLYMIFLSCAIYWSASAASHAYYVYRFETFNHIINFTVKAYEDNNMDLPAYVNEYQKTKKCCGWGPFYWNSWPSELNHSHIPSSCCKFKYFECGLDVVPKRPSGYLVKLAFADYKKLQDEFPAFNDFQKIGDTVLTQYGIPADAIKTDEDETTDEMLRGLDEAVANLYHFLLPAPTPPSPSPTGKPRSGPVGLDARTEVPLRIYPRKEPNGKLTPPEESLLYFSRGLEEFYRVKAHLYDKPCETANSYGKFRGVDGSKDRNMMEAVKNVMRWTIFYGIGLGCTAIIMAAAFWYYFSRATAKALADEELPKDFQDLGMEAVNFGYDDRGAEEDAYLRAKIERIKQQREEKKRAIAEAKAIADQRHAEHQMRKAEQRRQRRRRRRIRRGEDPDDIKDDDEGSDSDEDDDDEEEPTEEDFNKELKASKKSVRFGGEEAQEAPEVTPAGTKPKKSSSKTKAGSGRASKKDSAPKGSSSATKTAHSAKGTSSATKSASSAPKGTSSAAKSSSSKAKVSKSRSGNKSNKVAPE